MPTATFIPYRSAGYQGGIYRPACEHGITGFGAGRPHPYICEHPADCPCQPQPGHQWMAMDDPGPAARRRIDAWHRR